MLLCSVSPSVASGHVGMILKALQTYVKDIKIAVSLPKDLKTQRAYVKDFKLAASLPKYLKSATSLPKDLKNSVSLQ